MSKLLTLNQAVIRREKRFGPSMYDYSVSVYRGRCKPINILCPLHGMFSFKEAQSHFNKGSNCPSCESYRTIYKPNLNKLEKDYEISSELLKNDSSEKIIKLVCKRHQEVICKDYQHLKDNKTLVYCTECIQKEKLEIQNISIKKYKYKYKSDKSRYKIQKENTFLKFKNKFLDTYGSHYNFDKSIYITNKEKLNVLCTIHNIEFKILPHKCFVYRQYCPDCREEDNKTYSENIRLKKELKWKKDASEKYNNYFDYSKVIFKQLSENVIIVCPKHGEFEQKPNTHLARTYGCQECGAENSKGWQKEDYIKKVNRKIKFGLPYRMF